MNEKLAVTIPPEPPELSVFLDRARRAWQRIGSGWYMAGTVRPLFGPSPSAVRWGQLLLDFGEGEVIWQPADEAPMATPPPATACVCERGACFGDDQFPDRCEHCTALPSTAPCPADEGTDPTVVHLAPSSRTTPIGFLGFTQHGRPVGGEPPDNTPWPAPDPLCPGNPNSCRQCHSDAALMQRGQVIITHTVTGAVSPAAVAAAIEEIDRGEVARG